MPRTRPNVHFWTDDGGRELAMLSAQDLRDAMTERDELRAENARLLVELTHRVGWEERCLRAEAENDRLASELWARDQTLSIVVNERDTWKASAKQAEVENQQLRAKNSLLSDSKEAEIEPAEDREPPTRGKP